MGALVMFLLMAGVVIANVAIYNDGGIKGLTLIIIILLAMTIVFQAITIERGRT